MESIQAPFDTFSSNIYDSRISQIAGACEHATLRFAEKFALKLVKTYKWIREGENAPEKTFCTELFSKHKSVTPGEAGFFLNIKPEKGYVKFLEREKVIQNPPFCRREAILAQKVIKNGLYLAATSPVSIPAGAIAVGLRWYVQSHMHDITCLKPASAKVWKGEPIEIFDSNVALTEFLIMNYLNGVPDTKKRVKGWARILAEIDADIICLQEAFDVDEIYPHIAKELQALGYYVAMVTKRAQVFGMTGGLFLACKYRISDIGFHEYTDLMGIDKRSRKGVLAAIVELAEGINICVATTHMQGGYPKGTKEKRIRWKTQQFCQARVFLHQFTLKKNVKDHLFIGDYNCSRFENRNVAEVASNDSYQAMVQGLLKPLAYQPGFKDLNYPDRYVPFKDSFYHQSYFDNHNPKNNESGEAQGSCFNTAAVTYQDFVKIIALKVSMKSVYSVRLIEKMVKKRLKNKPISNEFLENLIDTEIALLEDQIYRKGNVVDHIAMMSHEENLFDETGYDYELFPAIGNELLTDHMSLWVRIYPKPFISSDESSD